MVHLTVTVLSRMVMVRADKVVTVIIEIGGGEITGDTASNSQVLNLPGKK